MGEVGNARSAVCRIGLWAAVWAMLPISVHAQTTGTTPVAASPLETRVKELEESVRRLQLELSNGQKNATAPASPGDVRTSVDGKSAPKPGSANPSQSEAAKTPEPDAKSGTDVKGVDKDTWLEVGKSLKMEGTWKNGLQFQSADQAYKFNIGGVIQFDLGWFGANKDTVQSIGRFNNLVDPGQTLEDGFSFRRARIRMNGTAYEQVEYFAQYDFANSLDLRQRTLGIPNSAGIATPNQTNFDPADSVLFNEVYVGLVDLPYIGNLRIGRHRESLNFVTATSDNYQVWMERGLLFEGFNSSYNFSNGVTVANRYFNDRAYALFGVFQQNNNNNRAFTSLGDGNYVYDARITCLPIWNEEDQLWGHVGFDYSHRSLYQNYLRYRARPDLRIGSAFQVPNILDSGNIFSNDAQQIMNLELASAWGRWTATAEAACSFVPNAYTGGLPNPNGTLPAGVASRGTYFSQGAYAELLYFLTPDHRPYRKERPGYDRVSPTNPFFCVRDEDGNIHSGCGAWEVGIRYDYLDLTNAGINGGTGQGVSFCINWYLSSNTRFQANYVWMHRDFQPEVFATGRTDSNFNGFGLRVNCDF